MKYVYHCVCNRVTTYEVDKYCKPLKIMKCTKCGKNVRYMGDDLEEPEDSDDVVDNDVVIQPEIVKKMKFKIGKKIKKELTKDKKKKPSSIKRKSKKSN